MHRWFSTACRSFVPALIPVLIPGLMTALAVPPAFAAWPTNPDQALQVASAGLAQENIVAVSDGDDGALVFWEDSRAGTHTNIYAARILKDGSVWWTDYPIAATGSDQFNPAAISDGAGGAFVVWDDYRNGGLSAADIYATRVGPDGALTWGSSGVPVVTGNFGQNLPKIVDDGAGGMVIGWVDYRTVVPDVYAQRLNSNGVRQWLVTGVLMCGAAGNQTDLQLIPNPTQAGSAIAAWVDTRVTRPIIVGQLLNSNGSLYWGADGIVLTSSSYHVARPRLANVADGNFAIAWEDTVSDDRTVRMSVYNTTLSVLAGPTTVASNVGFWPEYLVDMVPDGTGGVLVNFYTDAGGAHVNHIERLSSGLFIHYTIDYEVANVDPVVVADGAGGAYAAFGSSNLVLERISSTGTEVWDPNGVPVSISAGTQENAVLIPLSDGSVLTIWEDGRFGNGGPDVFANRVDRHGYLGDPAPVMTVVTDVPDDQGGVVYAEWNRSYLDQFDNNAIWGYGVWRAPVGNPFAAAATAADIDTRVSDAVAMGSSEAVARHMAAQGWEQVSYVSVAYQATYSAVVPTYSNYTGGSGGLMSVKVVANGTGGSIWWESDPMNGYSEDNLAPAPPILLTAVRNGSDVELEWSPSGAEEIDFSEYIIYRGVAPGVIPEPLNFLTETPDTMLVDTSADPGTEYWYIATARDIHENESGASNEAMVDGTPTGIGDTPALTALQVSNFPNPFSAATEIRVGVAARSDVTVAVYDVAGRRVFERELRGADAGWHSVRFDGRGVNGELLPSGVYFARVTSGAATQTRKMVISR